MKRLLFFINPNAGHAEIRSSLMEVLAIFCKGGYEPTVHMTTGPRDITRQIAERGTQYDLIVCTGGDGTLNEAVSGLMALPYENAPRWATFPAAQSTTWPPRWAFPRTPSAPRRRSWGQIIPAGHWLVRPRPVLYLCRRLRHLYGRAV